MYLKWFFEFFRKELKVEFNKTVYLNNSEGNTLMTVYCKRFINDLKFEPVIGDDINIYETHQLVKGRNLRTFEFLGKVRKRSLIHGMKDDDIHTQKSGYKVDLQVELEPKYFSVSCLKYEDCKPSELRSSVLALDNHISNCKFSIKNQDSYQEEITKISNILDELELK